jgi:hypothetical protein
LFKIPQGSPTTSVILVKYHTDFVSRTHSDFFQGHIDRGLLYWPIHIPGNSGNLKKMKNQLNFNRWNIFNRIILNFNCFVGFNIDLFNQSQLNQIKVNMIEIQAIE